MRPVHLHRAGNLLEASTVTTQDLTASGAIPGTISFMSPEQVQGEELDLRTDLFSFGVVIYEMATGRLPFQRKTVGATFAAILHEPPEPVTQWNAQLPAKLDEIVAKALQKDRRLRYQHASEIRGDLQQLKAASKSTATTPAAPKSIATPPRESAVSRRSVKKIAIPACVTLLAVLGATIFGLAHKPALHRTNLNEKDTIVLADFTNSTGDPVFDNTLKKGLPFLCSSRRFSISFLTAELPRPCGLWHVRLLIPSHRT
jgi:eukaryotic-like serine/threonine-protein kinase